VTRVTQKSRSRIQGAMAIKRDREREVELEEIYMDCM
jgi:hypothetical protein